MVEQIEPGGNYRVGSGMVEIAAAVLPGRSLIAAVRPHLHELVKATGEAAGLSIADGFDMLYLDQVDADNQVQIRDWTGERLPAHTVSSGQVLLAFGAIDADRYLAQPLERTGQRHADRRHGHPWPVRRDRRQGLRVGVRGVPRRTELGRRPDPRRPGSHRRCHSRTRTGVPLSRRRRRRRGRSVGGRNCGAGAAVTTYDYNYDYVIVGGGSAGSALANRLSADPTTTVLVLEAGRPDYKWDVFIHMPAALTFPIGSKFYDWKYESEPEPFMNGRKIYHARGKVLGGSSSINGMIFQRGNPLDFERWAADPGMETWDYAHCLPYFKKMENCLAADGNDVFHGHSGPLELERGPATNPLFGAFFDAVQQAGYPITDDVNGFQQEGLRQVRSQRAPWPPVERGARLPAPGDAPQEPHGHDPRPGTSRAVRRHACDRCRVQHPSRRHPTGNSRRGHPVRRSVQLAATPAAQWCRQCHRSWSAGDSSRARPPGGRPAHAGPSRGLRAVLVQAAGVAAAAVEDVATTVHRRRVAVPAQRTRCVEPLRGWRVSPAATTTSPTPT